jgi:hypothetical protein
MRRRSRPLRSQSHKTQRLVEAGCLDILGSPANDRVFRMESEIANTDGDNRSATARTQLSHRCVCPAQLILVLAPACVAAPITNLVAFEVSYFIKAI